jgi:hypothetical protein
MSVAIRCGFILFRCVATQMNFSHRVRGKIGAVAICAVAHIVRANNDIAGIAQELASSCSIATASLSENSGSRGRGPAMTQAAVRSRAQDGLQR